MFKFFKRPKGPSDRPLTASEQAEVKNYCRDAADLLVLNAAKETPDQIQKRLYAYINDFREGGAMPEEAVDTALAIGCLWGYAVCRQLKWQWAYVEKGGQGVYAIVSPGREYVVYPMLYAQRLLTEQASDQTSLLLYNMMKAGKLPPASERSYLVLS